MPEHILAHVVFLSQILLISYYFPRKIHGRMRHVFDTYPPSTYPKLYPKPIEHYERAQRNYRLMNLFILLAGLATLAALFVNSHDGDLDNAVAMGFFFVQMLPMMLLELSSYKELRLMRDANSRTTRKAELHPRRLFDFVSPTLAGAAAVTYIAFVLLILYLRQFDFPWFGGYLNIAGITAMNMLFAGIVLWNMYGKKLNPHQANADREKQIQAVAKILTFSSIAATVFVVISIALSALDVRHLLPVFLSMYFQLLAAIGLQAYLINFKHFEVYKEDPLVT